MQKSGEAWKRRETFQEKRMLAQKGYLCRGLLGKGAFSRVYWVETTSGSASYACKISENGELLEREAQILALLQHPLFPEYYDFWKECDKGFLLREYISGSSLEEMLGRRGRFSAGRSISMGLELAEGLKYLHGRQEHFLFRDIKPSNIILRQDGRLKLIDLGCVCSLNERVSSRAGSPGYAAPEQLRIGGVLTTASDVYGLGQTLKAVLGEERMEIKAITGKRRGGEGKGISGQKLCGKWSLMRQKALRKKLIRVLEACTREEAQERIRDMESMEQALRGLRNANRARRSNMFFC